MHKKSNQSQGEVIQKTSSNTHTENLPNASSPAAYSVTISLAAAPTLELHEEKIAEANLPFIEHYRITDWSGRPFDGVNLIKWATWWVNSDKSVMFMGMGGGAFEIPEMYALVCFGAKVRIECGGGGDPAIVYQKTDHGNDITLFISHIDLPNALLPKRDAVMQLAIQAFAAYFRKYRSLESKDSLTVQYRDYGVHTSPVS